METGTVYSEGWDSIEEMCKSPNVSFVAMRSSMVGRISSAEETWKKEKERGYDEKKGKRKWRVNQDKQCPSFYRWFLPSFLLHTFEILLSTIMQTRWVRKVEVQRATVVEGHPKSPHGLHVSGKSEGTRSRGGRKIRTQKELRKRKGKGQVWYSKITEKQHRWEERRMEGTKSLHCLQVSREGERTRRWDEERWERSRNCER